MSCFNCGSDIPRFSAECHICGSATCPECNNCPVCDKVYHKAYREWRKEVEGMNSTEEFIEKEEGNVENETVPLSTVKELIDVYNKLFNELDVKLSDLYFAPSINELIILLNKINKR